MAKILVLDGVSKEGVDVFHKAGFEVVEMPPQKPEELAALLVDFDGLVVRSGTRVTADALKNPGKLRVIGRAGAGVDNIEQAAATDKGIVVMNTPGGNTISTCEHAFALLFSLCRNIPAAHASMEAGRWDRKKFMGSELCGKTLGIIGLGRIGGAIAKRALAFEMKVIAFDPIMTQLKADALGVSLVSLEEMYAQADFITVHAPKSDKTNNLIGTAQFAQMKKTCRLINCARGGIINEQELAEALKNKVIAGAALDVYTTEPFENNPFIGLDNIVMTPHLAASTDEAQVNVGVEVAHQMVEYLNTGAVVNAVNVPSLDSETAKAMQPLLFLAERLGEFQAAYSPGRPSAIAVEYHGEIGVQDTYAITASILTGFLRPTVETVNMVSAPSQLKARGIECSEHHVAEESDYAFAIGVKITTDQGTHTVQGTLFNGTEARICSIDGTRMNAKPAGHMLICKNQDVPMVIGRVCMTLGEAGVNIANLTLGREAQGGKAMTVLNLDQAPSAETLAALAQVPSVLEVALVTLPEA